MNTSVTYAGQRTAKLCRFDETDIISRKFDENVVRTFLKDF
jgi:hypothetical protein